MEQAYHRGFGVKVRCSVVASKDPKSPKTDVEEQLEDGEVLLSCFSPLLSSMRILGLYFKRTSRRIHDRSTAGTTVSEVPRKWNGGRIYATIVLVLAWLNAVRMLLGVFEKTDKFGVVLLLKLAGISAVLLGALIHTACFVACYTGNLDRVFHDARLLKSDVARYRRLAVIHAIVCWIYILGEIPIYIAPLFIMRSKFDMSLAPFMTHVFVSDNLLLLVKFVMAVMFLLNNCAWCFSHSVNYMAKVVNETYVG